MKKLIGLLIKSILKNKDIFNSVFDNTFLEKQVLSNEDFGSSYLKSLREKNAAEYKKVLIESISNDVLEKRNENLYKNTARVFRFLNYLEPSGKGKLLKYFNENADQYQKVDSELVRVFIKDGKLNFINGSFPFNDHRSAYILLNEIVFNQEYYFESDTDCPLIIDCGVHIGTAISYFKHIFPKSKIIGFEPISSLRNKTLRYVQENKYTDVSIEPYALSADNGEAFFQRNDRDSMAGRIVFSEDGSESNSDSLIKVHTVKLSGYLDQKIDFLKMDIEGAELEVFQECAHMLKNVVGLFCEFHYRPDEGSAALVAILDILVSQGFDFSISKSFGYSIITDEKPSNFVNKRQSLCIWAKNKRFLRQQSA